MPLLRFELHLKLSGGSVSGNRHAAAARQPSAADPEKRRDLAIERAQLLDRRERTGVAAVHVDLDSVRRHDGGRPQRKSRDERDCGQYLQKLQHMDLFFSGNGCIFNLINPV